MVNLKYMLTILSKRTYCIYLAIDEAEMKPDCVSQGIPR